MKESIRFVYLLCKNCGFGRRNEWRMTYGQYYSGGFIEKTCPICHVQDTRNSIGNQKNQEIIILKGVDF